MINDGTALCMLSLSWVDRVDRAERAVLFEMLRRFQFRYLQSCKLLLQFLAGFHNIISSPWTFTEILQSRWMLFWNLIKLFFVPQNKNFMNFVKSNLAFSFTSEQSKGFFTCFDAHKTPTKNFCWDQNIEFQTANEICSIYH